MFSISFFRVIKTGLLNFWRNIWLSLAATLVMVITLVILSVLLLAYGIATYSVTSIKERVDISVYFKTGLQEKQMLAMKEELETNPKVKEVTYTSAEIALQNFRARHQNDPLVLQSLNELTDNPLPASLQIKAINLDAYPEIAESLKADKYQALVSKVNFEDNRAIIQRLSRILEFIITFGLGLVIVFAIIAILVIFNTLTLTIYNRREEVEIMRLVGATNWYIRGPFLVESLLYSLFATLVTGLLLIPLHTRVLPMINLYLNPGSDIFNQKIFSLPYILLMQLVTALLLSFISSMLAIRRYLKI